MIQCAALRPSCDRRRVEQMLTQRRGRPVQVRHPRNALKFQLAIGVQRQFHRALYVGAVTGVTVEVAGQKDRAHQRCDIIVVLAKPLRQLLDQLRRRVFPHEIPVDLGRNELGGGGLLQQDVDNGDAVQGSGLPQNGFGRLIMIGGVHDEFHVEIVPAGERPCGLADVFLGVVTDAQREEFHDLARKVLVRRSFHVHAGVKERQHAGGFARRRSAGRGSSPDPCRGTHRAGAGAFGNPEPCFR